MRDFPDDAAVGGVFADVNAVVAEHLRPAGVAAVYSTVRRRRRNRVIAASTLAVALVLGPVAGLALANSPDRDDKPPVADTTTTPPTPSPGTVPPTTSPASPTHTHTAPDGRISLDELGDATLAVGEWSHGACASGEVPFTDGVGRTPNGRFAVELTGEPVYADVDGDGAEETAIVVRCVPEAADYKVLTYDRDGRGRIVLVGQVVTTDDGGDGIEKVWSIKAAPDGDISVDVGDWAPCCGVPADLPQHQWRTYGWNGDRFVQTDGPTAFGPNPKITDLQAGAEDVTLIEGTDGRYEATLQVAIHNRGPADATLHLSLSGSDRAPLRASVIGKEGCAFTVDSDPQSCELGGLRNGDHRTVRVSLVADAPRELTLWISVSNGVEGAFYPDFDTTDNNRRVPVRTG